MFGRKDLDGDARPWPTLDLVRQAGPRRVFRKSDMDCLVAAILEV